MLTAELIRAKRDGGELDAVAIGQLVAGITDDSVSDAQVGALAMAIFLRGMSHAEQVALTGAMMRSGEVLRWGLDRPVLDKHSTGGVGDKVSLLLAPILAACGGAVPMISGRGLGHTGGTLDKLESIPGYDVSPSAERFREVTARVGCAIIGQTGALAPADRRLYAIRDATATVESLPLIVASILSKKLAAGLDGLVMDVKAGSGAFMPELAQARELARAIVAVARGNGLATSALLTDMNQVLGRSAGNALEVLESIEVLTGSASADQRLVEVTLALSAELLVLGGLASDRDQGRELAARALADGGAAGAFAEMVAALGGPTDLLERPSELLPRAPVTGAVESPRAGFVSAIDVRALGIAVVELGGGRVRESDTVDHAVGLTEVACLGERVGSGERPLAVVHARDQASLARAAMTLQAAFAVADAPGQAADPPVIDAVR